MERSGKMLQCTKEYVAVVDLDRARWAQHEALVLQARTARRRSKITLLGQSLIWLGSRLVHFGYRREMPYETPRY